MDKHHIFQALAILEKAGLIYGTASPSGIIGLTGPGEKVLEYLANEVVKIYLEGKANA